MRSRSMKSNQERNRRRNSGTVKKILFLALHLGYGGAEKAIAAEANMLSERYDVEIACAYKLYDEPAFPLNENVRVQYLSETLKPNRDALKKAIQDKNILAILREGTTSIKVLWHRKAAIKRVIRQTDADVIVSTRYIFHQLLGRHKQPGVITIAQEHNHHDNDESYIRKMVDAVRNIDYFMPVSKELTEFYTKRMPKVNCVYIPHSLDYIPETTSSLMEPMLISVGRLSPEKGYLDLIEVFAGVSKQYPDWKLHIIGDGEERDNIQKAVEEHHLTTQVKLHGYQNKDYINQLLARSSIYLMTSFSESFGIVLIEAQSFGIPCVAFDSARGALEIICDQKNGYLIPNRDVNEMRNILIRLMEDDVLRKELGKNGRQNALQYATENVQNQWFEFIETL